MTHYSKLPLYFYKIFEAAIEAMFTTAENIKTRMSEEGAPIRYPVQWDSEKQRRAFFATNGFGKGIPYKRTHKYRLGWKTTRQPYQGHERVLLSNKHPAGAVGGMVSGTQWQSRIHRGRWNYILKILSDELSQLPYEINARIKAVAV
jgi:hypothetical protein